MKALLEAGQAFLFIFLTGGLLAVLLPPVDHRQLGVWLLLLILALIAGALYGIRKGRQHHATLALYREAEEALLQLDRGSFDIRVPPLGPQGEPDGWSSFAHVLNEVIRRLLLNLEATRETQRRMEAIVRHSTDGILLVDMRRHLITVNPAAFRLLGVATSPALGAPLIEVFQDAILDREVREVLKEQQPRRLRHRVIRRGERASLEIDILHIATRPTSQPAALILVRDVTEQERLDTMRRDFIANASHELKTPLTSVQGFAETLLSESLSNELRQRYTQIILDESHRMSRIVDDLLQLSHLESGHAQPNPRPVDFTRLARRVTTALSPQASAAEVQLRIDTPPTLRVLCDEAQIEHVLINLITNGIHYTPPGGEVTLQATLDAESETAEIRVTDTGIGIPTESLQRIFERFYRVDKARAREKGGTGLGLAIVKHILRTHNQEIFVESRPDHGSTFWFHLPIADAPQAD